MDNFESPSNMYQVPSLMDDIQVNMSGVNMEEELQQFTPLSLTGHNENLADLLPQSTLNRISAELVEGIEEDLNSRKEWEDDISEGLKFLGLKMDMTVQFPFDNACGSYSPLMMQAAQDFMATAIAELLPLEGPAKEYIVGDITDELQDQADRIEAFFNLFITEICEEYYPDFKKMLLWVFISGMCVRKTYFDRSLGRPTSAFLMPQDFIVNYSTTNLKKCWRMTEVLTLNKMEVQKRKNFGTFLDIDMSPDDGGDESNLEKTVDQVEGIENASTDNKIDYTFYECHTYLDIEQLEIDQRNGEDSDTSIMGSSSESGFRPYSVTIHKKTNKILSIYRNWEEGDESFEREDCYTDFGFSEGLGFYKFGAVHLIGGLSKTSTALLRQTIDGQTLNNFPGGMRIKGMRLENNNISIGPCEWIEVDTGGLPINQAISPMPYREPSPAINALRNELEQAGSRIMGAANRQIADFNPNAPVGTTLALLDLMNLIQSTVLRGIRDSMAREFKKFYKIFSKVLPDHPYNFEKSGGKAYISKNDFIDQISLVPVADPHLTTKMQRIMRSQYIQEIALRFPNLYDMYEINKLSLKEMKLTESQIDKILPNKDTVDELDPVTENQNLMTGNSVKAFMTQDHLSHIIVHEFMLQDPNIQPQIAAAALAHIAEHKALQFQIQMQQMMGMEIPSDPKDLTPDQQNQIAMMAANALSEQQAQTQKEEPAPLLDPAAVLLEKVKVEEQAVLQRQDDSERSTQVKAFEIQMDHMQKMEELEIKREELKLKASLAKSKLPTL